MATIKEVRAKLKELWQGSSVLSLRRLSPDFVSLGTYLFLPGYIDLVPMKEYHHEIYPEYDKSHKHLLRWVDIRVAVDTNMHTWLRWQPVNQWQIYYDRDIMFKAGDSATREKGEDGTDTYIAPLEEYPEVDPVDYKQIRMAWNKHYAKKNWRKILTNP